MNIAKKTPVVFFGAGKYALSAFDELNGEYNPVAFCDNDPSKQGTLVMGLTVLSPDELEMQYPGCRILITVPIAVKYQILASLIEKGIAKERIINYEDYKTYKSCRFLESHMQILCDTGNIAFCCGEFGKHLQERPATATTPYKHEANIKAFSNFRNNIIEAISDNIDSPCADCPYISEDAWGVDRRIRQIAFESSSGCNFRCIYCNPNKADSLHYERLEEKLEFLMWLKTNGFIDNKNTFIEWASSEITAHPKRETILDALEDFPCWFYTNASAYNKKIAKILEKSGSCLIVSMDAGTRETFHKIKSVDLYDKVCDNLARYVNHGKVFLKYHILPDINDNQQDIDGFIALCESLKISHFDVSRDLHRDIALPDCAVKMATSLINKGRQLGISVYTTPFLFSLQSKENL